MVGNTIRLEIQNRRAEIEVTKLVGGTQCLRAPAVPVHRRLYGLFGGLTAWLVVVVALALLTPAIVRLAQTYGSSFTLAGPGLQDLEFLLGGGAVLGWLGSWLAAARHLARIEPGAGYLQLNSLNLYRARELLTGT